MTMASGLYVVTFRDALDNTNAVVDMLLSTNKVDLYTTTKTPNFDTDAAYSATNEVTTGSGYTQDTMTVGGTPTFALGNAGQLKYSWSTSVDWTSASFTAHGMIIHSAAANLPIVAVDFGADYTATNGTFSVTAHANGIFYIDLVPLFLSDAHSLRYVAGRDTEHLYRAGSEYCGSRGGSLAHGHRSLLPDQYLRTRRVVRLF